MDIFKIIKIRSTNLEVVKNIFGDDTEYLLKKIKNIYKYITNNYSKLYEQPHLRT